MNFSQIEKDYIFKVDSDSDISVDKLKKFIEKHKELIANRYSIQKNAYEGRYPILDLEKKDAWKPDNRVVVNFAKYIVDTFNGFFIGVPIKITSTNDDVNEYINFLDKYNDQDDNNAELSKMMSIYGKAYELYYVDDSGKIAITYLSPIDGFMIYSNDVVASPIAFVLYYVDDDKKIHTTVYNKNTFVKYDDEFRMLEEKVHGFDDVPVTEFIENEERMCSFESVYSMINTYNKVVSEKANDVDYFADAYLKILGAKVDENSQKLIRSNRIINFEGSGADNIIVEFLQKPESDVTQENILNRLERLIYQLSMIANMNDENFGTSSGIAIKYKLLSMNNLAQTKERKFTSGMNRRYKVIFSNPINLMKADDWVNIEMKFTRNYPTNISDEAETASKLSGIVSKETQLSVLSVVDDVAKELERIDSDNDIKVDYPMNRVNKDE